MAASIAIIAGALVLSIFLRLSNTIEGACTHLYSTVNVNPNSSVAGIIGRDVYDTSNRKIATIDDVLFDSKGNASRVVLSNGGIMGMGAKLVVLDFGRIYQSASSQNVISTIAEDTIRQMTAYSTDPQDVREGMQTMGKNEISAKAMLDGELLNDRGNEIGSIENITIDNSKADQVIVSYDTTLGMGGEKIAIDYDRLQRVGNSSEVDFKLPADLTVRFEAYTKPGPASNR
jgi:sporulation protein YlmC with PRC-barrel domain